MIVPILLLILFVVVTFSEYARKHELRALPGPKMYALTSYRLTFDAFRARMVNSINSLHQQYGPVVRIGPDQVSFNSLSAMRTIYGAGSGFERSKFYRMFDVYGRPNLFTFGPGQEHRERKKLISHIYSNQSILGADFTMLVKRKVVAYLALIEREPQVASEIFTSLHYFSIDAISEFVYGPKHGGTKAMAHNHEDRGLLLDILSVSRRRLAWFAVHFPHYTKWVTTRRGLMDWLVTTTGLLPTRRPFVYTGIREHALKAYYLAQNPSTEDQAYMSEKTVVGRLRSIQEKADLSDMDIASECADHLLAGIDTTADSLMFLIWALSRPQNQHMQDALRVELTTVAFDEYGVPNPKDLTNLPYLTAIIKETLRLYAPLPTFEPRMSPIETVIDNFRIPAGTIVGMSPYCLHRDAAVYTDPLTFDPYRWLTEQGTLLSESDIKNRYFWAFSSGARMCIGMHLANSEMSTLTAAIFSRYRTRLGDPKSAPGITSRFEIFSDELAEKIVEHECYISFERLRT